MTKVYTILTLVGSGFFLLSYSANPPDGNTGAPGDGFCIECHQQGSDTLRGDISVEGFPSTITPGETYPLTIVNRNTQGNAKKGGFQMTILGPFNTRAGTLAHPSVNSAISNSQGRQYFEHDPAVQYPDSNVIKWTVDWTAPEITAGSKITWYASGNIANGDFNNTGDRIVSSTGQGEIVLSTTGDLTIFKPALYPNPGKEEILIQGFDGNSFEGQAFFFDLRGVIQAEALIRQGKINVPDLTSGIYWIQMIQGEQTYFARWIKI